MVVILCNNPMITTILSLNRNLASLSHPENVNPSIIVYAVCDADIKLVFKYAKM